MKYKSLLFVFTFIFFSCGKSSSKGTAQSNLNRLIDAQVEGNFSANEATLGGIFCTALAYKKNNFASLYGSSNFTKKFSFEMSQKNCNSDSTSFTQLLKYSSSGSLAYTSASDPGVVPFVETDTTGAFSIYCANRSQNSRIFVTQNDVKVYHFYSGSECGGDSNQICAVYESANSQELITNYYKRVVISNGTFLNLDLKGQEVFSDEQAKCDGSTQTIRYTLRQIQD
jgi:hypothetical protein